MHSSDMDRRDGRCTYIARVLQTASVLRVCDMLERSFHDHVWHGHMDIADMPLRGATGRLRAPHPSFGSQHTRDGESMIVAGQGPYGMARVGHVPVACVVASHGVRARSVPHPFGPCMPHPYGRGNTPERVVGRCPGLRRCGMGRTSKVRYPLVLERLRR